MPASLNRALEENNFGDKCAVALIDHHRVLWNKQADKLDPTKLPKNKNLGLSGVIWTDVHLAEESVELIRDSVEETRSERYELLELPDKNLELIRNSIDETFTVLKEEKIPEKPLCEYFNGDGELIHSALDEPFDEEEELRRFKEMAERQRVLDKQKKLAIEQGNADEGISEAKLELLRLSIEECLPPPIQRTSILVNRFTMGRKEGDLNSINGTPNENKMYYPNLDEEAIPCSEKKVNRRQGDDDEDLMDRSIDSSELVPLEMDTDIPKAPQVAPSKYYNGFSDVKYAIALEEMNTKVTQKVEDEDECRSIEGDGLVGLDMDFSDEDETEGSEFEEVKNERDVEEEEAEEDVSILNVINPEQEESFESLTQDERKLLGRRMLFF